MYIRITPMLWSSEIWQNSVYKRSRKYSVLYAGGFNERKFSWRWNIVAKLLQGMKNNLWKNESKIIFRCLVRALWKCTESPIEIMQIRYGLRSRPISNFRIFYQNKNSLELLNIIFENSSSKGSFGANEKKLTTSLNNIQSLPQNFHTWKDAMWFTTSNIANEQHLRGESLFSWPNPVLGMRSILWLCM